MNIIAATATAKSPLRDDLGVRSPADTVPYLNCLFYGEPGAGKTWLAGTAEDQKDTAPVLFLDVEGGVTTLRKRKNLDVVQVRSMDQIVQVHDQLEADKSHYYKTVVIDSLTELQKLDMRTVMKEQYNKKPDSTDIDVPSQREWGKNGERVRRIVRAYRDLPMNTIMTALAASEKDEGTGVVSMYPMLPGKMRAEVPGYFDIVGYLAAVEERNGDITVRKLQLAKTRRIVAKDRTSALGQLLEEPTIPMMWELIHK